MMSLATRRRSSSTRSGFTFVAYLGDDHHLVLSLVITRGHLLFSSEKDHNNKNNDNDDDDVDNNNNNKH